MPEVAGDDVGGSVDEFLNRGGAMRNRTRLSLAAAGMIPLLAACGGAAEQEPADAGRVATAAPPAMVQDTLPMDLQQMRLHLRQMQGVHADSLRAMLPLHRQMFSGMMGHMQSMMGDMRGMPMMRGDTAWTALMDSMHLDMARLDQISGMSDEELERWMAAHRARALRMIEMYPAMHPREPDARYD